MHSLMVKQVSKCLTNATLIFFIWTQFNVCLYTVLYKHKCVNLTHICLMETKDLQILIFKHSFHTQ